MTAAPPVDQLERALEATGALVAAVRNDQWEQPSNCGDWTVRMLVNHIVVGSTMFAAILRGDPAPSPEEMQEMRATDHLGADPIASFQAAGAALVVGFSQPDVLQRDFNPPVGAVSGAVMLHLRVTETLVHGWDLAVSTAQPRSLPNELAEQELAFSRQMMAQVARSSSFGPEQPVAPEAPAIDRLVAYLGRSIPTGGAARA